MKVISVSVEWWQKLLATMIEPPNSILIEVNPDWLPIHYRRVAFWQKLADIPQVVQLEFVTWPELTGFLYDRGFVVEESGQTFFNKTQQYHHCRTFAGKPVGYVVTSTSCGIYARLDSRLEEIANC